MQDSGWRCDKSNSMTIYFFKASEINDSSYVKIAIRSSTILNIKNVEKNGFPWSNLAHLHLCGKTNPRRV